MEPEAVTTPPLEQIGEALKAIDREQAGLVQAMRLARARGFSWAKIGVILGVSRQAAQQRFGFVDDELRRQGKEVVDEPEPAVEATSTPQPQPPKPVHAVAPEPQFDFSAMAGMTDDEIIAMAKNLPIEAKLYDPYLRALREAIVVTLHKRGMGQAKIAAIIHKSAQRVSQIIGDYYTRKEREWQEERARWGQEGA
jgi:DNA invertase Pin-like site-specific DNA recombinase